MGDFSMGALLQLAQVRLEAQPSLRDTATTNQSNQQQTQGTSNIQQQEKISDAYAKEAQRLFKK